MCESVYPSVSAESKRERERCFGLSAWRPCRVGRKGRRPSCWLRPYWSLHSFAPLMHSLFLFSYLSPSLSLCTLERDTHTADRAHPFFVLAAVGVYYVLIPISLFGSSELAPKSLEVVQLCQSRSRAAKCAHAQRVMQLCSAHGDVRLEFTANAFLSKFANFATSIVDTPKQLYKLSEFFPMHRGCMDLLLETINLVLFTEFLKENIH